MGAWGSETVSKWRGGLERGGGVGVDVHRNYCLCIAEHSGQQIRGGERECVCVRARSHVFVREWVYFWCTCKGVIARSWHIPAFFAFLFDDRLRPATSVCVRMFDHMSVSMCTMRTHVYTQTHINTHKHTQTHTNTHKHTQANVHITTSHI